MSKIAIIPKPADLQFREGSFNFSPKTTILADEPNQENGAYLRDFLAPSIGRVPSIQGISRNTQDVIILLIDPLTADIGEEGYALVVEPESITIKAPTSNGVFYGIQTLRQLLPIEIEARNPVSGINWGIPCCQIKDQPRFPWRGYMLDEGRHFHGMESVLRTIDLMALQKLNILHWHLTEDQGWRIEIKCYPKLTEVGSLRAGTVHSLNDMRVGTHDGVPHGGYYTQGEVRQIVAYAAQRKITIIPEIEIPGHATAALAAYPLLSCTGGPFEVGTRFGIFKDVYCPGRDSTFEFLQHVLDEVMDLFPSKVIHIGGDEVPKTRWKVCPDCQRRIQDEGLIDVQGLQVYTTNRIGHHLTSRGRKLMGWNEILGTDVSTDAIIQYWIRGKKELLKAIRKGQKVVNSTYMDTYLDHSYALTPLSRAYNFDPIFRGLDAGSAQNILGIEAPMWTEWVPNRARLDYQTYPRLTALAEVGWTPKPLRDYTDFRERLTTFIRRLEFHEVGYAPKPDWDPPWYRRIFGSFTIAKPQRKTA